MAHHSHEEAPVLAGDCGKSPAIKPIAVQSCNLAAKLFKRIEFF